MQSPPFGILNLNKPGGVSSRWAVNAVQKVVRPARVGHAGTLDPLATGVLVVCVGRATRLIGHVQSCRKKYRATFVLGQRSNTDDVTGELTVVDPAPDVSAADVNRLLPRFVGCIEQVPPAFSAVHVGGRRAYKLARGGEPVQLAPRRVEVHDLRLVEFIGPAVVVDIECGSGTYVRSIGRDLGELLGCGAVMSQLQRTAVGHFTMATAVDPRAVTPESLEQLLLSPATAVAHLPRYYCRPAELEEIGFGRSFPLPPDAPLDGALGGNEQVALLAPDGELAALAAYQADKRQMKPKLVFFDSQNFPRR